MDIPVLSDHAQNTRSYASDGDRDTSGSTHPGRDRGRGRRHLRRRERRGERGATLVEYALLVAVFAIPTIAAINALQDTSKIKIEDTASRISSREAPGDGG